MYIIDINKITPFLNIIVFSVRFFLQVMLICFVRFCNKLNAKPMFFPNFAFKIYEICTKKKTVDFSVQTVFFWVSIISGAACQNIPDAFTDDQFRRQMQGTDLYRFPVNPFKQHVHSTDSLFLRMLPHRCKGWP